MSQPVAVMNSIDFILAKKPIHDKFTQKLVKGYQERRAVTRLVNSAMEQLQSGGAISFEWKNNTSLWKAGTTVLDLNVARDDDPSFFGLIAHVFKLCFVADYAKDFDAALNAIADARDAYFLQLGINTTNVQSLSDGQEEKTKLTERLASNGRLMAEVSAEIGPAESKFKESDERANAAFDVHKSSYAKSRRHDRLQGLIDDIAIFPADADILSKFAQIVFDCKLKKGSSEEAEMVAKVSTPEQRAPLIELHNQRREAEAKVLDQAKIELQKAEDANMKDGVALRRLNSRYQDLVQEKDRLVARETFLDQEIARLKALVP